ncbi:MAG TPA: diaminopimelate decarboxylase [Alphaproteobacteria bacterium]|jgi:diaminopimelate decarboxylase|nr:diaminopimelate decarboxylase [Alphaproteobacteria bacterium]
MSAFAYRRGALHAEDVPLERIAGEVGTPVYVYSTATLLARYHDFERAFAGLKATICYALKANGNQAVVATLARAGAGADIVSEGELRRALAAAVPPDRIVFAGVGKTEGEMRAALAAGIKQFNVESEPELRLLSRVARTAGRIAPVSLRINPDVDANTHAKITTGRTENKFGIDIAHVAQVATLARELPGLELRGLAVHIGSQLTSVSPFRDAFARLGEVARRLIGDGHRITNLDFGGGVGILYDRDPPPDLGDYAAAVRDAVAGLDVEIVLEPGRFLVAEAGVLLSRVLYMKDGGVKRFAIIDAAMNDLIRPTLYEAFHPIRPVREPLPHADPVVVDVVGPICESGDILAIDRPLAPLEAGDLVAIGAAGAYGAVMASTYNARPLVPEVLVDGNRFAVVRPRQTYEELIALDRLPPWLEDIKAPRTKRRVR